MGALREKTERPGREPGQAAVEAVVIVVLLVQVLVCMLDVGRAVALEQNLKSAASTAAAAVEADPSIGQAGAQAVVDANYPQISGAIVALEGPVREEAAVDYKIYSPLEGDFKERPSKVATDSRAVRVTYAGKWASPALIALSGASGAGGAFELSAEATAVSDATGEVW